MALTYCQQTFYSKCGNLMIMTPKAKYRDGYVNKTNSQSRDRLLAVLFL